MKNIKRVLFGLFLSVLFITSAGASTVTIKETTDTEDNYNTIVDGTVVIGITKFDSSYNLTATEVVTASYNDFLFNLEAGEEYEQPKIYVYAGENWYELDKENNPIIVSNAVKEELSTNNDIFYVNNDEKELVVPFVNNISPEGDYELEVTTDKIKKFVDIEDGVLKIPATVKKVEIAVIKEVDGNINDRIVIESIQKEDEEDSSVTFEAITNENGTRIDLKGNEIKNYIGTMSRVNEIGGNYNYDMEESYVAISGTIAASRANNDKNLPAGNLVAFKISAPDGVDSTNYSSIKVNGDSDVFDANGEYVWYEYLNAGTTSKILEVTWVTGVKQTFVIYNVNADFEDLPAGIITGIDTDTMSYDVTGNDVTVKGIVNWYKADVENSRDAGNYAAIKITAPEGFNVAEEIAIDDVKSSWEDNNTFIYYPRFDEETKAHTITIKWENGNIQTINVKLADDTTLEDPYKGRVWGYSDYDKNIKYTALDNDTTLVVGGKLSWVDSNERGFAGNYAAIKFIQPEGYTNEEVSNAKITVNNLTQSWVNDVYYFRFNDVKEYTVVVTWQAGNEQTFTVKLAEDAELVKAPAANIEGEDDYNGKVTYAVENNTITIGGTLEYALAADIQNGRKAGNYAAVKVTAPTYYKDLNSVEVKIDNVTYTWNDVMEYESEVNKAANAFVYYPRFDGETKSHTITIKWENGNIQTFNINLAEGATLEKSINVGNTEDFQAALNDENIEKVVVTNSFDLSDTISINANRKITIDFGGNTITAPSTFGDKKVINITKESNNGEVTFTNGTLKVEAESTYGAIRVGDKGVDAENEIDLNGTKVILDKSFKVESKLYGLVVRGSNFTVDVNGEIVTGDSYAISGGYNSRYKQNITININETAKITSNDIAIYMPSYMIVNIKGGEITANTVVGIKLGELNISGGTLTATGTKTEDADLKKTGNGVDSTGDVIYAEINDIYYTHYQTNNEKTDEQVLKINITGGILTSINANTIRELNLTDNNLVYNVDLTRVFSADKTEVSTYNDIEANLTVNGVKYTTKDMQRAIDVSGDNVNVTLLTDIDLSDMLIFN